MNKRIGILLATLSVLAVVGAVIWLLGQVPGAPSPSPVAVKAPAPVSSAPVAVAKPDPAKVARQKKIAAEKAREKRWQGKLAADFHRVADVYAQTSKYPPYSLPIDKKDLAQYRYNRYFPVKLPLQTKDGGKAVLTIMLEQLHFQKGDPILGVAKVSGAQASKVDLSEVSILSHKGKTLYQTSLGKPDQGNSYSLVIQPPETQSEDWPAQLMLRVSGTLNGDKVDGVVPFFYDDPIGRISEVGDAYIDGANLIIPVTADLKSDGYYAISGNLYSTKGQPLVHLEAQARMSVFDNTAKLKVHRVALQAKGDAGPYLLKDLMLRKLPDKPGDRTLFGPVDKKAFHVNGFPFSDYSQAPYTDPMRKARLEFLRHAQPG